VGFGGRVLIVLILSVSILSAERIPVTVTITPKFVTNTTYLTVGIGVAIAGDGMTALGATNITLTEELEPTTLTFPLQLNSLPSTTTLKVTVAVLPGTGLAAVALLDFFVMVTSGVGGLTISTRANLVDVVASINGPSLGIPAIPFLGLGLASTLFRAGKRSRQRRGLA